MLEITPQDLDANPFLLCTPNATYDLRLGMAGAREHSPEDFITKITTVSPGTKGMQIWLDCLNTIFCGDKELILYVQNICGLAAVGKVEFEALIISYGGGRNGKSTFWNAIARVLGLYSGNISADTLTCGCRRNVKPEMAEVKGKRLLTGEDLKAAIGKGYGCGYVAFFSEWQEKCGKTSVKSALGVGNDRRGSVLMLLGAVDRLPANEFRCVLTDLYFGVFVGDHLHYRPIFVGNLYAMLKG